MTETSPIDDPAWRSERARRAGAAGRKPLALAQRLLERWEETPANEQAAVRALLSPVICATNE